MPRHFVASSAASVLALAAFVAAAGYEEHAWYAGRAVAVGERDGTTRPMTRGERNTLARLAALEALPYAVATVLLLALPAASWGHGMRGWPLAAAALGGLPAGALTGAALATLAGARSPGPSTPYLVPAILCGALLFAFAGGLWPRHALARDGPR